MSEPAAAAPAALLLSDDLIFASRVGGTAAALGLGVRQARTVAALLDLARRHGPRAVLVDLAFPGLDLADLLARLGAAVPHLRVIAYGSHVDTATLRAARALGCDPVLPRSKFVEELPHALPAWLGVAGAGTPPAESGQEREPGGVRIVIDGAGGDDVG